MRLSIFKLYVLLLIDYYQPHGYELMKIIKNMSHELLRVGSGTIYPLLFLLKTQGLVREVEADRRKKYMLTEKGVMVLRENLPRLHGFINDLEEIVEEELKKHSITSSQ